MYKGNNVMRVMPESDSLQFSEGEIIRADTLKVN
jgi:hypothetical protein